MSSWQTLPAGPCPIPGTVTKSSQFQAGTMKQVVLINLSLGRSTAARKCKKSRLLIATDGFGLETLATQPQSTRKNSNHHTPFAPVPRLIRL
jgi:hypothetical protein